MYLHFSKIVDEKIDVLGNLFLELSDRMEADTTIPEDAKMDSPEAQTFVLNFLTEKKDLIAEASKVFEETTIYNLAEIESEKLVSYIAKEPARMRPIIAFDCLTDRVAKAPFYIVMESAFILILPVVNKFLKEYLAEQNGNG